VGLLSLELLPREYLNNDCNKNDKQDADLFLKSRVIWLGNIKN
jgi:hypothetical protein